MTAQPIPPDPAPGILAGKHVAWCDSQLGPDFEVKPGEVVMTIFACMGCLPAEKEEAR